MNKKIILHIGFYKTGSSFIQSQLDLIKDNDCKIFSYNSPIIELILKYLKEPIDETKNEILNIIYNQKCKSILISSEGILGHQYFHFEDVPKRFQLLEELFNKPKYIIFFREPSSIIYSGYFHGLQKSYSLRFENYINKNENDLENRNFYNYFVRGLNYKIYDYNIILNDFLKIYDRVLFVEYEKFFKEKNENVLNNFIGTKIKFDWNKKVNISLKNLKYLEFYRKFLIFKYFKIFWIKINKPFFKFKEARDISLRIVVLINFLVKFTPKEYLDEIENKHQRILEQIKDFHSKNYYEFKNKLNSAIHISSNSNKV
tara:strand:- start:279 stop:1223 length:945 start_codon:yes stop_codon:yes gene_type:complete